MTTELTQAPGRKEISSIPKNVKSWLSSDYFKQQVALCLPKHLTPERFIRIAISATNRNPKLLKCTPESVMKCLLTLSELGLEPDGRRAHLIPFDNKKAQTTECTLIVDYKGLVELAMNSGTVSSIFAEKVCDKDSFEWDTGEVRHKINWREDRGEAYAFYCVITFKDGGKHTEVMTKADIQRIRARSRAANNGPWVSDPDEMSKKTVFRRGAKWVKLSPEVQDAIEKAEAAATVDAAPASLVTDLAQLPEGSDEPEPDPEAQPEPEKPKEIPVQAVKKEPIHTVQQTLQETIEGAGFTWDQFGPLAEEAGWIPDATGYAGFAQVPTEIAKRLNRSPSGMLMTLRERYPAKEEAAA